MIKYNPPKKGAALSKKLRKEGNGPNHFRYKRILSMGKVSMGLMNEIGGPIDAVNRFINLTLQSVGENSQGREFLLESKEALRKTSILLKKLNGYAKKIEKEVREISSNSG